MFRALFFLLKLAVLALALLWFVENPGTVHIVWQGYEIDTSVGVVAAAIFFLLVILVLFDRLWRALINTPVAIRRWRKAQARELGYDEITRGFAALAAGDQKTLLKKIRRARELVPDTALSGILSVGAARIADDKSGERLALEGLLDDKRVAFLGLRGLLAQALESGDHAGAIELARRAENMHPKQGWIVKTLFDLEVRARHWKEAAEKLERLLKLGGIEKKTAARQKQVLLLGQAQEEMSSGRTKEALKLARRAFGLNPAFVPAAVLAADLFSRSGKRRAALKTIRLAWGSVQHPDLADLWMKLSPLPKSRSLGDRQRELYAWARELAEAASYSIESKRLLGHAALEAGLWDEARDHLHAVGDYRALSRLEIVQTGSQAQAREWLELAADSPLPKKWVCSACGHAAVAWGPACSSCGGFDTFSWETPGVRPPASAALPDSLPPAVF